MKTLELTTEIAEDEDVSRRDLVALIGAVAGSALVAGCVDSAHGGGSEPRSTAEKLVTIGDAGAPQNFATLEAALAAIGTLVSTTLIIDKELEIASAVVTVPANVTLRFQDRGQLQIPPSKKVILAGPIEAPASPKRALFKVGGLSITGAALGGDAVPMHSGTKYYANWWSDVDGNAGTAGEADEGDIGAQWNLMLRDPQAKTVARQFAVAGTRSLETMLDARNFNGSYYLDFTAASLEVHMSGGIAVNFTNSNGIRVNGLSVIAPSGAPAPHVGVLLARAEGHGPTGNMQFDDLRIASVSGWLHSALCNIASNSNVFVGGRIENHPPGAAVGPYTAFFGNYAVGLGDVLSAINGTKPPTSLSNFVPSDQVLLATKFWGKTTVGTLYIRAFSAVVGTSLYVNTTRATPTSTEAQIVIDAADTLGLGGIKIDNLYSHGNAFVGLKITGVFGNWIAGLTFSTRQFSVDAEGQAIAIGQNRLEGCKFRFSANADFFCHSESWMRQSEIEVLTGTCPVQLGRIFTGRISVQDLDQVTPAWQTFDAEVFGGGNPPGDTTTIGLRHYLPVSVMGRTAPPAAPVLGEEVVVWFDKNTLQLKASVGPLPTDVRVLATFT